MNKPGIATLLFALSLGVSAHAAPLYPMDDKVGGTYPGTNERCLLNTVLSTASVGLQSQTPVHMFLERDMWTEWNASFHKLSDADGVTKANTRSMLMDAAEVWNRESRFRSLIWGGFVTDTAAVTSAQLCTTIQAQVPVGELGVYVRFVPGSGAAAGLNRWLSCDNVVRITVYGYDNSQNVTVSTSADLPPASAMNLSLRDFAVDGRYVDRHSVNPKAIQAILVHELGHLRLGHRHDDNPTDPNRWISVMSYGQGSNYDGHRGIEDMHLYTWDKDCIDDRSIISSTVTVLNSRQVVARFQEFTANGELFGDRQEPAGMHVKGGRQAGTFGDANGEARFARYRDDAIKRSTLLTNGVATTFPGEVMFSSAIAADVGSLYVSPTLLSLFDPDDIAYANRMLFVEHNYANRADGNVDPPAIKWAVSSGSFGSGASNYLYDVYDSELASMASHISPVGAYNPITEETMVLTVNTDRTQLPSTGAPYSGDSGRIQVAPLDEILTVQLGESTNLDELYDLTTITYFDDGVVNDKWSYDLRTQTQPGLACSDAWTEDTNCVIAWKDAGSPDGHILYTQIGIDADGNVVTNGMLRKVMVGTNDDARTAGDVSVAYFADRFWIAYKTWGGAAVYHESNILTAGSVTFASTPVTVSKSGTAVVDAPSWQYVADDATAPAMLTWTSDAATL
jgi:hypothetical protein